MASGADDDDVRAALPSRLENLRRGIAATPFPFRLKAPSFEHLQRPGEDSTRLLV